MGENKYLEQAEMYARDYDSGAMEQSYHGPDILFGLMYEFLGADDLVLDIAIGTGLEALLFKKAGARVTGIDGASEMLRICREKKAADKLIRMDFLTDPFPFPADHFDLAVANSIFHMVEDPSPVFRETSRVMKQPGIFGFTIDEFADNKSAGYKRTSVSGIYRKKQPESGLYMFRHSDEFIDRKCRESGFEILKKPVFLAFRGQNNMDDFYFTAYIARKNNQL